MELILAIGLVVVIGVLIGFAVDRIQVGGDGIWYGPTEPPEGFVGFWDRGETVVQWPKPERVEDLVVHGLTSEDIVANSVTTESIQANTVTKDTITANALTADTIRIKE